MKMKKKSVGAGNQALRAKFLQSKQEAHRSGVWLSCNQKLLEATLPSSSVSVSRALLEKHWSLEMHRLTFLRGLTRTRAQWADPQTRRMSAWRGNLSYSWAKQTSREDERPGCSYLMLTSWNNLKSDTYLNEMDAGRQHAWDEKILQGCRLIAIWTRRLLSPAQQLQFCCCRTNKHHEANCPRCAVKLSAVKKRWQMWNMDGWQ